MYNISKSGSAGIVKMCPELPGVTFRQSGVYEGFSAPECPQKLKVAFTLYRRGEEPVKFTNGTQVRLEE